jgi:glutamate-5-semialdehyde dehydrogenase
MMESMGTAEINEYLKSLGTKAQTAKTVLQGLTTEQKNHALTQAADALVQESERILSANEKDCARAEENGMAEGLLDRLKLTGARMEAMAEGLRQIASLPDPVGEVMETFDRPNGLHIEKVRVPMGVIGIIYEARPNVTADAFGLCFKTGNAVILKGGRDAFYSNQAVTAVIGETLEKEGIDKNAILLIENNDRAVTTAFMKMKEYVDVLIPRGGAGLIRSVVENSTIPVIETGTGNCHIFIDESADLAKAVPIVINAKTQRIGVCNACESLLVHEKIADKILPALGKALLEKKVEIRGDEAVRAQIPEAHTVAEEDYGTEYLDLILSVKTVASLEEAIAHINKYNTGHSDSILTQDQTHAQKFLREVDSACVYVNASTRFTDGFEFGFGAEIGISTQKLHARGPMGLKELTSYKYQITGTGQVRP